MVYSSLYMGAGASCSTSVDLVFLPKWVILLAAVVFKTVLGFTHKAEKLLFSFYFKSFTLLNIYLR